MRLPFLPLLLALVFAPLVPSRGAEQPPAAINSHFDWCGEAKTNAEKLRRFEGFWRDRLPAKPDEYDDHPHVTYVRRCAYRLAALYSQTGQIAKCLKMLKWLEANDESLPENARAAPTEP